MFGPCVVMQYSVSFLILNHLAEEERAGCFTLIVLLLLCGRYCYISFPQDGMYWFVVAGCGICWSCSLTFEMPDCSKTSVAKDIIWTCLQER